MPKLRSIANLNVEKEYQRVQRLHLQGNPEKARAIYQQILKLKPKNPYVLHMFGVMANQHRMYDTAVALLQEAVDSDVVESSIYGHLALALRNAGQMQEARTWYERSLQLNPDSAEVLHNFADLLLAMNDLDNAVQMYRQALEHDPTYLDTYNNMAEALLKLGELEDALKLLDFCLGQQPGRVRALSLKCVVLSELGRTDELGQLMDLDRLIFCHRAQPVSPFTNLDEFQRQLSNYISRHPRLTTDSPDISTRRGLQTAGNLFADKHVLLDALRQMIQQVIDAYVANLTRSSEHPHALLVPKHWRLEGWGVRLENQGFQTPHVHYDGWNSCVYYLSLPKVIDQPERNHEGWIQFGFGPREYYKHSTPPTRLVKPEEGLFVMFPSWFWHETVPFESDQPRICIAFDIIPSIERQAGEPSQS